VQRRHHAWRQYGVVARIGGQRAKKAPCCSCSWWRSLSVTSPSPCTVQRRYYSCSTAGGVAGVIGVIGAKLALSRAESVRSVRDGAAAHCSLLPGLVTASPPHGPKLGNKEGRWEKVSSVHNLLTRRRDPQVVLQRQARAGQ
jgi:hypothetical protein